jgi:putative phosphoesterase
MDVERVPGLSDRTDLLIGLVSDTHIPEAMPRLWPQVFECFDGVDLILHGGDLHDIRLLDELAEIAPVYAARGNGEDGSGGRQVQPEHPRLRPSWLLDLGGLSVGLTHAMPIPPEPPHDTVEKGMMRAFGRLDVDIVVYGDTHVEREDVFDGTFFVNPGSPTYPHNLRSQLGTIACLRISNRRPHVDVLQLTNMGTEPFDWTRWRR